MRTSVSSSNYAVEGSGHQPQGWQCNNCGSYVNPMTSVVCQNCNAQQQQQSSTNMPQYAIPQQQPQIYPYVPNAPYVQPAPVQQYHPHPGHHSSDSFSASITVSVTNNITVKPNNQIKEELLNEQYDYGDIEDIEYEQNWSCVTLFVWWLFGGGLLCSIFWFVCGLIYIYWFKACFRLSSYLLFGVRSKHIRTKCSCYDSHGANETNCCCDGCFSFLWVLLFGVPMLFVHFVFGLLWLPFLMCGNRFSVIHFKIAKIALFNPFSVELVRKNVRK